MASIGLPILTAIKAPVAACEMLSMKKSIRYNESVCYQF